MDVGLVLAVRAMAMTCPRLHCDSLMVMAAVRYCLGRASYIVPACTEWLDTLWPSLDDRTRALLRRDIQREIAPEIAERVKDGLGKAGLMWQTREWKAFLDTHPEAP